MTDVVVLGAGPYGLAATAQLRRAGADVRVFGEPMSMWRGMPKGMLLRSNWTATSIVEHDGPLSLDSYVTATGRRVTRPVPLEDFIDYGDWIAEQVAPDVDRRPVVRVARSEDGFRVTVDDGERVTARRVVVAAGIGPFARRPDLPATLPAWCASHSGEHQDLGKFAGQDVLVIGGGQSALEAAALLKEGGASPEVLVRADHINWLHGGRYQKKLGRLSPLVYAPTDVGPMGLSRVVSAPWLFRRLPRDLQDKLAYRAIRPAGALWLRSRLEGVPIRLGRRLRGAVPAGDRVIIELDDGTTRVVDHVIYGTGYQVDLARYTFLSEELLGGIRQERGYPVLRAGMESSVPGLHFLGAPAAWSYGPINRFVSGTWYASHALTAAVTGRRR
ncbi:FAD-dependent oxidoreductase [Longispora albida]|uniref:FAD-dependent oxidoreductase n=1 Tax=Longispora albida TaxID=203523 RepID=UPI000368A2CB|nr:FAD-dependent oxidoreductase [Longispora albida]